MPLGHYHSEASSTTPRDREKYVCADSICHIQYYYEKITLCAWRVRYILRKMRGNTVHCLCNVQYRQNSINMDIQAGMFKHIKEGVFESFIFLQYVSWVYFIPLYYLLSIRILKWTRKTYAYQINTDKLKNLMHMSPQVVCDL